MPGTHNFDLTKLPIGQPRWPAYGALRVAGFDTETIKIIYEAYLKTRRPVYDVNKSDPVNVIIALRILSPKRGERDPDRLRAATLATLPVQPRF